MDLPINIKRADAQRMADVVNQSGAPTIVLLGGDSYIPVKIPATLLIAFSPLLKSVLDTICPCLIGSTTISLPFASTSTLHLVSKYLSQGKAELVGGNVAREVEEMKVVLDILCPEAGTGAVLGLLVPSPRRQKKQHKPRSVRASREFGLDQGVDDCMQENQVQMNPPVVPRLHQAKPRPVPATNLLRLDQSVFGCMEENQENEQLLDQSVATCGIVGPKISTKEQQEFRPRLPKKEEGETGIMCQCKVCFKFFASAAPLVSHMVEHYPPCQMKFRCFNCKFIGKEVNLIRHIQAKHTLEECYCCSICPVKFNALAAKSQHMNKHRQPDIWNECPKHHFFMDQRKGL